MTHRPRRQVYYAAVFLLLGLSVVWFHPNLKIVNWNTEMCQAVNVKPERTNTLSQMQPASSSSSDPQPLRDIHMVMIGDSLMRYQYLSLAYRLKYGVWFDDSMWYFSLVHEQSFADPYHNNTWGAFLFHTHGILQPQEATCDCYRKNDKRMGQILENRYYYDARYNNSLVLLLAFGHAYDVVGRLSPEAVWNQTKEWQTKAFREVNEVAWRYRDWSDVIRYYVRLLQPQPQHIVLNAGLWRNDFGYVKGRYTSSSSSSSKPSKLSNVTLRLLQLMNETPEYQYVWRTTTFRKDRVLATLQSRDEVMCERLNTCIDVSFSKRVRQDLYWDDNHFLEPFYRVVNEQMLEQLGYLPDDYVRMNLSDILEQPPE